MSSKYHDFPRILSYEDEKGAGPFASKNLSDDEEDGSDVDVYDGTDQRQDDGGGDGNDDAGGEFRTPQAGRPRKSPFVDGGTPLNGLIKSHWQKDATSDQCSCGSCNELFSFMQRRHHCRCCGGLFVNNCSQWKMRCMHKSGVVDPERVCRRCTLDLALRATSAPSPPGEGFVCDSIGTMSTGSPILLSADDDCSYSNLIIGGGTSVQTSGKARLQLSFCVLSDGISVTDESVVALSHCFIAGNRDPAIQAADSASIQLNSCVVVGQRICAHLSNQSHVTATDSYLIGARQLFQKKNSNSSSSASSRMRRRRDTLGVQVDDSATFDLVGGSSTVTASFGINCGPQASVNVGPGAVVAARTSKLPAPLSALFENTFALAGPNCTVHNQATVCGRVVPTTVVPAPIPLKTDQRSSRRGTASSLEHSSSRPDFIFSSRSKTSAETTFDDL